MSQPTRVLVTGAAGQIAYSLIYLIARGELLGSDRHVILHLLDIPFCQEGLNGVVMEIQDGAYPLVKGIVATTDVKEAFTNVDIALLVGSFPRKEGMERKDLLKANAGIFTVQGAALNEYASKNVKVLVVGNPANTNAYIAMKHAPSIPKENFSALTRLDHNRAKYQIANRIKANVEDVHNVIIWGNHSATQYPDVSHGFVTKDGKKVPVTEAVNDEAWLHNEFITIVQQRGAAIIKARKFSSAASAAKAIVDHARDWIFGTPEGEVISMAVRSDGSYGIQEDLIYSFPVTTKDGKYTIVQGLSIDAFSREKMDKSANELKEERDSAHEFF
jgi:malate dehydrogenase